MLLAGRCFAPLSKWQQKEYWLKFLIWGKNVGNKQVLFLFQSEASELNIYIKWKSMQKNLSEEQRQRDQCPSIEWVLDNQEVKKKCYSLFLRSASEMRKLRNREVKFLKNSRKILENPDCYWYLYYMRCFKHFLDILEVGSQLPRVLFWALFWAL